MRVEGTVMNVQNNRAVVSVKRSGGCGRCHEAGGCGGGESSCEQYSLNNPANAVPGQRVEIDLPEGGAFKAAFVAYMLPVIGMLLAVLAGKFLLWSDIALFGACLAGGALGLWVGKTALLRGWLVVAAPRIVRVVPG